MVFNIKLGIDNDASRSRRIGVVVIDEDRLAEECRETVFGILVGFYDKSISGCRRVPIKNLLRASKLDGWPTVMVLVDTAANRADARVEEAVLCPEFLEVGEFV